MYYLGLICLVASTLALPTISDSRSPSSIEIQQKGKGYKHYVEIVEGNDISYAENTDTDGWKEDPEIDDNIYDHDKDSKEVENREVEDEEEENEEAEDEEVENEEVEDKEVTDEEVEDEWVEDEKDSDEKKDEKYSNFEKSVIIKWKIPRSFLLNSLIANASPADRPSYHYGYQPYRFPYAHYPGFVYY